MATRVNAGEFQFCGRNRASHAQNLCAASVAAGMVLTDCGIEMFIVAR
jgi:hypothetical protein